MNSVYPTTELFYEGFETTTPTLIQLVIDLSSPGTPFCDPLGARATIRHFLGGKVRVLLWGGRPKCLGVRFRHDASNKWRWASIPFWNVHFTIVDSCE